MNSKIGGQAVIEGVMMKNAEDYAVAVRKANGEIVIDKQKSNTNHGGLAKLPIIRGMVAFVDSLVVGMKTLTYSASLFEDESDSKKTKEQSERGEKLMMGFTVVLSIIMAIAIFMVLPWFLSQIVLSQFIKSDYLLAITEGLLRLVIFIIYIVAISQMEDIKRVFMYHGAEHKSINCIENGLDLTVANVKQQSRCHKRCGTSFMFFVIIISIITFMFIPKMAPVLQALVRVALVPIIAGLSYEVIRLMGSSETGLAAALSKPGFAFQKLTTREPDDDMIEVAIASVEAVFNWREFVEKVRESEGISEPAPATKKTAKKPENQKKNSKKSSGKVVADQSKLEEEAKAKEAAREEARARRRAEAAALAKKEAEEAAAEAAREAELAAKKQAEAAKKAEEEAAKAAEEAKKIAETKAEEAELKVKEAVEAEAVTVKEAVEAELTEAKEIPETKIKSLRNDNGLSSLDKVLFVKSDMPVREFKDPLAGKVTKVRNLTNEEEDDEVLSALDKFFDFKDKKD